MWAELQEGLLIVFGPVVFWFLVMVIIGTVLSVIGAVMLEAISKIAR